MKWRDPSPNQMMFYDFYPIPLTQEKKKRKGKSLGVKIVKQDLKHGQTNIYENELIRTSIYRVRTQQQILRYRTRHVSLAVGHYR